MDENYENLNRNINELRIQINGYERKNINFKENLDKEQKMRIEQENENKEIKNLLLTREKQIDDLNKNYDKFLIIQRDLNNENTQNKIEIEKYKNNCKILSEQNNILINEIQNVISVHEKFQNKLTRKEKIRDLLNDNKNVLQQSLINIDNILSNNNYI
jgi:DNA-binding MurR/RpiR family transcriptional regulator